MTPIRQYLTGDKTGHVWSSRINTGDFSKFDNSKLVWTCESCGIEILSDAGFKAKDFAQNPFMYTCEEYLVASIMAS